MTPKEKAEELINKFSERTKFFDEYAGWLIHLDSSKAKGHALMYNYRFKPIRTKLC